MAFLPQEHVSPSSPPSTEESEPVLLTLLTLALGFVIPGAGHISIGQVGRGLVFGITILALFAGGMLIGGVQGVSPSDQPIWRVTQMMAFGPYMLGTFLKSIHGNDARAVLDFFPKLRDVGSVYCGIAGMLNMLVLFDAFVRINGLRRPGLKSDDAQTGTDQ